MLPFEVIESGMLIIRLQADLAIADRAAAAWAIDGYLAAQWPTGVVLELSDAPLSPAAASTVARVHRMCHSAGAPMSVVAADAEARRALTVDGGPAVYPTLSLAAAALPAADAPVAAAA
ncbi:hypothetical protein OTB20_17785 [Streptomyces sp. H27-H1]|uniref:hypothetical protein n=1 Tax=Streptomyces sp. H27-H1 TaxID=2996461 RepID=UPI002270312B|nr:hypothetical protein [Streptomyces sp. H27-H1]MCY0928015.1 hypothetical protein [Streptomyces sp. H27-H1]